MKLSRKLRITLGLLAVILLVGTAVFLIWAENPLGPMPEAEAALQSDEQVMVSLEPWMTFEPVDTAVDTGFIFYPGGRVDARSYAPPARAIAAAGYLVVIPPMPLNLAVFDSDAADDVIAAHEEITKWVIGGHSLGGAMAANYVYNHPGALDGLVLWASYPAENNSLVDHTNLRVLSVYGTEDGQAEELAAAAERLPVDTVWTVIEGGNHAQFGWYGRQSGDGEATISREDQQEDIVQATTAFLSTVAVAE
ncbi:MAG: alpha/beta hydrolase [Ardenticatenaceae bacterium]|nr:alpha/beta hydrolase [Ardenticatenaceae bacterium]MCB9445433.1 alpha/beta hydrolase [Ardenticatenaceae bacterium]